MHFQALLEFGQVLNNVMKHLTHYTLHTAVALQADAMICEAVSSFIILI